MESWDKKIIMNSKRIMMIVTFISIQALGTDNKVCNINVFFNFSFNRGGGGIAIIMSGIDNCFRRESDDFVFYGF